MTSPLPNPLPDPPTMADLEAFDAALFMAHGEGAIDEPTYQRLCDLVAYYIFGGYR